MLTTPAAKTGLTALTGIGGLGLLACAVCCAVPLIGALGLGAGLAAVVTGEPLVIGATVVLLAVGAWGLVRSHKKASPCSTTEAASCSTSGCGCGAKTARPPATAAR